MRDDERIPASTTPSKADFEKLEVEHEVLQDLLGDAMDQAERHETDAAASERRIASQGAEIRGQASSIRKLESDARVRTLELREKETLLAWVLNSSVDGVLVYRSVEDDAGAIVDFECVLHNPAAVQLYEAGTLEGRRLLDLHPDLHETGFWSQYLRVVETGEPFEGDYRHERGGVVRWSRVLAMKMPDGLAITFSDITHRKELEAQILTQLESLRRADRMKDEFLGVISHELRTPINGFMGYLSILEDELAGPLNETQHDYVAKALERSETLLALVANLLDMSRMQAGKFRVEPRAIAFAPLVERVATSLIDATHLRVLVNEVPAELPPVLADPLRTTQVLMNLVGNAIKFTPPGGTITMRAAVQDGFVRCEVADTGIGIAPADQPKLFHVFSQVDMSSTREVGGVGLGLSIAKHLVEAQGGTIGVESREGEGATFWFTLPVAAGPDA